MQSPFWGLVGLEADPSLATTDVLINFARQRDSLDPTIVQLDEQSAGGDVHPLPGSCTTTPFCSASPEYRLRHKMQYGTESRFEHLKTSGSVVHYFRSIDAASGNVTRDEFEEVLTSVGFPSPKTAAITILELHATDPPL